MSEFSASTLRDRAKDKARARAAGEGPGKVDASSYEPPEGLNANIKTGMRPVSRQAFKRGGKVDGAKPAARADRTPRKSGGLVNEFVNRNEKDANAERPGGNKQRGGYADGGVPTQRFGFEPAQSRLSKAAGLKTGGKVHSDEAEDRKLIHKEFDLHDVRRGNKRPHKAGGGLLAAVSPAAAMVEDPSYLSPALAAVKAIKGDKDRPARKAGGSVSDGTLEGTRPTGGRMARKSGGKAGKTNINIIIGQPQAPQSGGEPLPPPPMKPPMMPPPAAPPPGAPPPGGPPMGAMPRKRGGAAYTAGALSGEGRLQKIDHYGDNAYEGEKK